MKRPWLAWGIAIICLIGAAVLSFFYLRQASVEAPETRLEVVTPPTSEPTSLAISPDGRLLAFVATSEGQQRLWLRSLDKVVAQALAGTEGAINPFWSPDSRSIGFFAERKLKRIDIRGGPPQVLANVHSGFGGAWSRAGVIVYSPSYASPLYRIPATGGEPVAITQLDLPRQTLHAFPQFLPDGRHLLFFAWGTDQGIYIASLGSAETRRLIAAELPALYSPPGFLLFMRKSTLFAQSFDPSRVELAGDPVLVADSLAIDPIFNVGGFSVSEAGMLVYRRGVGASRYRLAWYDRAGKEVGTLGVPDENNPLNLNLSPDNRRVALNRTVQGNSDIWLIETARGVPSRLTFDAANDLHAVWSPDGSRIVFASNRKGAYDLYQKASSGAGSDERLLESSLNKFPCDWSQDGRFLLYTQIDPKTGRDLCVLPLFGERKPFPFINTSFDERNGQFSPDARWVSYESNESGQIEVFVQPFPGPGGKWQVSTGGGIEPRWSRDGKELFYIAPDDKLMAVPIQVAGQTLNAGAPVTLFRTRIVRSPIPQREQYAVASDGRRFLIDITDDESAASPITIVTNWTRALKK